MQIREIEVFPFEVEVHSFSVVFSELSVGESN